MDTSGDGIANIVLYLVVLAIFVVVAVRTLRTEPRPRRVPVVAICLTVVVGVPSLLQFAIPALGEALRRDPARTLGDGEWWRVLTSLVAQDGGLVAAIFNLVVVAAVVSLSEWIQGAWRTLALFLAPSIILNLIALSWGSVGGGSSFASDGLMLSVLARAAITRPGLSTRIGALLAVAIAIALVALNDAHGLAMLVGALLGAALAIRTTPERRGG